MARQPQPKPAKSTQSKPAGKAHAPRVVPLVGQNGLLRDQAYSALKERILSGDLPPGTFLSERQVAGWLKMSKTPIRVAFGKLEAEGLVSITPQHGVVVKELTLEEIADHFELRNALESFVVRQISGRLTRGPAEKLEANLAAQQECLRTGDLRRSGQLDGEFHILLCECLGNQEIMRVFYQIRERMFRVIQRVHQNHPERLHSNYPEHRAVFEAIQAGDGEIAAARMREHLEHGHQFLMATRLGRLGPISQGLPVRADLSFTGTIPWKAEAKR